MSKINYSNNLIVLPFSKIFFKLAIPNLYSTLIAAMTIVFDLWYVGQIGVSELAGVAYIFPVYMLTSMLSNGAFGGAISGSVARAFGSQNFFQASCVFRSAIIIAILGSLIMMSLYFFFSETFFDFFKVDEQVTLSALIYGDILLSGIIFIWLFNVTISVTRGSGNTIIPAIGWTIVLLIHILAAAINFKFDSGNIYLIDEVIFFGGLWSFSSLQWAIISLILGYVFGIIFMIIYYIFGKHPFALAIKDILKFNGIFRLIRSGSLASCQSLMTIALALYCTTIVSNFGTEWIAGFGIAIRLELLLIPIIFGIGGTLIAIVGANVGAKKIERALNMTGKGTLFSVCVVGFIGILFSVYPNFWSLLFTDKKEIYDASNLYLNIVAPFYAFFALGLGLYFVSQAFNTLIWPVLGTLIRLTFVVMISQILFSFDLASPTNIFIIMSVGMMIYGVFISLTLYFGSWKKMINI